MSSSHTKANTVLHDYEPKEEDFLGAVISGLSRPEKSLPSKFFYDEAGSQLFDEICLLEEYYPTRTELQILNLFQNEISAQIGSDCHLVEFGSGSSIKVRALLNALETPLGYVPIDISREHLLKAAKAFSAQFPDISVSAICADYTAEFALTSISKGRYVGFFPGSTIGNFTPHEATVFLRLIKNKLKGGGLLIGVDLVKNPEILNAAYDDALGVTAAFNKNLLARCNRELRAEFDLTTFDHRAFFNESLSRIEMHLVSNRDQLVRVGDHVLSFSSGEGIHTENSYKYTIKSFQNLASAAGFKPIQCWADPQGLFSIHYLSVA